MISKILFMLSCTLLSEEPQVICVKKERLMRNSYGHYQKKAESRKSSVGLKVTYLEQPQDVGPDHLKQYFQTKVTLRWNIKVLNGSFKICDRFQPIGVC